MTMGRSAFPLLSDETCAAVKAFGVHDIENEIAIPAVFVIGKDGNIAWKHVGGTMSDRPPEDDIVGAVERAAGGNPPK
jgi:peroxiredoxin